MILFYILLQILIFIKNRKYTLKNGWNIYFKLICSNNNNNILSEILSKLKAIVQEFNNKKIDNIINQINNIIIIINKSINDNKKYNEENFSNFSKDIQKIHHELIEFKKKYDINEIISPNGKYKGQLKNNLRDGKGTFIYKNGDKYEGDWKNGKKDGRGIYYFSNGDRFDGEWKNNLREGKGILYWKNGDRYEGDCKNDLRDGKGIIYYANGDREMGDFINGQKIGKHVKLDAHGNVTTKTFWLSIQLLMIFFKKLIKNKFC